MNKWLSKTESLKIVNFGFDIPNIDNFTLNGVFIKTKKDMLENETYFESNNFKKGENE